MNVTTDVAALTSTIQYLLLICIFYVVQLRSFLIPFQLLDIILGDRRTKNQINDALEMGMWGLGASPSVLKEVT